MNSRKLSHYLENALEIGRLIQSDFITQDDACQIIGMKIFPENPCRGVGIATLTADRTYALTSTFGFPAGTKEKYTNSSFDARTPMVDAMCNGRVVWIESMEQMNLEYPLTANAEPNRYTAPVIVVPLFKSGITIGALGIVGTEEKPTIDAMKYLELISLFLAETIKHEQFSSSQITSAYKTLMRGLPLTS